MTGGLGAVVSSVKARSAGLSSTLLALSVDFTEKVWLPSLRPVVPPSVALVPTEN